MLAQQVSIAFKLRNKLLIVDLQFTLLILARFQARLSSLHELFPTILQSMKSDQGYLVFNICDDSLLLR